MAALITLSQPFSYKDKKIIRDGKIYTIQINVVLPKYFFVQNAPKLLTDALL